MSHTFVIRTLGVIACAALAAGLAAPAQAKKEAAPSPSATASASPNPSPTASEEPLDKQIPRLESRLKIDPNDRDSLLKLAADYLTINRPDLAAPLTQKLLQLGNKTAQVYYLDGYVQLQGGHEQQAVADLEQASNLDPTNSGVLGLLTQLYLQQGRQQDAERIAKRALTFNPNNEQALENYGLVLAAEKNYDQARTEFEQAAKQNPKDPQPIMLEARSYIDQNAVALAIATYDRALQIDPTNGDALLGEARLYASEHDVKNGIATYTKLFNLVTDPAEKAQVLDEEAHLYAVEKMDAQADALYKQAIANYPTVLGTHLAYGDYFAFKKEMPQAETEWSAALGPNRDNPQALQRLGEYYVGTNQTQKATEDFKRLTAVTPGDAAAWAQLGQLYAFQKQYGPAHDAYRQAYEISRNPQALVGMADADFELRHFAEASAIFDALDKNAPDVLKGNPELYFVMGQVYQASNQTAKARSAYQRFLAVLKPNSPAASQVKKILADLDKRPAPKATAKPRS